LHFNGNLQVEDLLENVFKFFGRDKYKRISMRKRRKSSWRKTFCVSRKLEVFAGGTLAKDEIELNAISTTKFFFKDRLQILILMKD
jgi:hypothetical protein